MMDDELGPVTDVKGVMVTQVFTKVGTTLTYEYDFGDGCMQHLEMVEISTHPIDEVLPLVISSENAVHLKIVVDGIGTISFRKY